MSRKQHFFMLSKVVAHAWEDPAYKKKLIEHPKETLRQAGIEVADNIKIKVLENTKDTHYFVLPEKTKEPLSEEDLMISGGTGTGGNY